MRYSYRGRAMPRRRNKNGSLKIWSENQKMEAAKMFLLSGSYTTVSTALEIPYRTLMQWRQSEWWKKLTEEIKAEGRVELSARMRKIASRALDITEDRLDNGNFQLDQKSGEVIRIPVNMKDAAKVANDLLVQQQKLEDAPRVQQLQSTVDHRLAKLAEEFTKFAKQKNEKVIEAIKTEYIVENNGTNSRSS